MSIPRFVIAGVSSGVGKTTITAGLITALRQRGLTVQPFKCGPDYIDPSYHERAAGRACRNLDTWMLTDTQLMESFARACRGADIAIVEGVMGLYDGSDWLDERGSTAQIAKLLHAPVLLVLDISGAARSAGATVLGFREFDSAVDIRGVVLNFAGSERHAQGCGEAIARATGVASLGWLPRELGLRIPERHLGLVPGGEQADSASLTDAMGAAVAARFDLEGIVDIARRAATAWSGGQAGGATAGGCAAASAEGGAAQVAPEAGAVPGVGARAGVGAASGAGAHSGRSPQRPVIAVARDEAFCFYYPENLELLAEAGTAVEFFSPVRGERPRPDVAGVYLGGGYPELHGAVLASNIGLWSLLRDLHAAAVPIYAECGGFMVLTEGLTDSEGHHWPMAGIVPGITRMSGKLAALGYRHATALRANLLVDRGESLRGHEFRYSSWVCDRRVSDNAVAWEVRGTRSDAPVDTVGYVKGNLLASYLHVHFGQRPDLARRFAQRLKAPHERPPDA